MLVEYTPKNFSNASEYIIGAATQILQEYQVQGLDLTLRQLYYQFVSRGLIPNKQSEYKRLGSIISDARLAGRIDWKAIKDRTRKLSELEGVWRDEEHVLKAMRATVDEFEVERWAAQPTRVEVWVEKDALSGVIDQICRGLQVPYLACKGYASQSVMWEAAQRFIDYEEAGQEVIVFYLGDHDPSGLDMAHDIMNRLAIFDCNAIVDRIALTMEQVEEHNPPPNPAKITDSRAVDYISRYGRDSWELDALPPNVMVDLLRNHVEAVRDEEAWNNALENEQGIRESLQNVLKDL